MSTVQDLVVLVDSDGQRIGTHERATVHHRHTPLHLAFSCYLYDSRGRVLITRRALSKRTFAGVWTNSFCGHPRPEEDFTDAVRRHARHELGITVQDVAWLLPDFRYRAVDDSGIVENEICPVLRARTVDAIEANPAEVSAWRWVDPAQLRRAANNAPWALSPWAVAQLQELDMADDDQSQPGPP